MTESHVPAWWSRHSTALAVVVVAILAVAASGLGLRNDFAYDDVFIVRDNPAVNTLQPLSQYFTETYWGPARGHNALYRPLTVWAYAVQWKLGGGSPLIFHAVNVSLYAAACVLLLLVLRGLALPGPALVGAAVFAVHPVHVEAVANVVGQAELWVACAVFGSAALFVRARQRGPLDWRTASLIAVIFTVSLFIKEHGIVLPALLLALELFALPADADRSTSARQRTRLLVLTLGLLAALYLLLRTQILGVVTGDEPFWGLRHLDAPQRMLVMLGLVPELLRLMLWPARLYADYSPQQTPLLSELSWAHLPGLLILVAIVAVAYLAWRRRVPMIALGLLWFAITYLPVANILYPIGVLIAERTLFLPSVAVACLAVWLASAAGDWPVSRRGVAVALMLSAVGLGLVRSITRTTVWADNPTLFSVLAVESPSNFRAHFALAEFNALGGRPDVADTLFQRALALYPEHVPARVAYGQVLQIQRRCDRALPLFESAVRDDPESQTALIGTVICLLDLQRFEAARHLALVGTATGWNDTRLRDFRIVAESVLVAMDSVDARNRFWRSGRAFERSGRPLRIDVFRETKARPRPQSSPQSASSPPSSSSEMEL